MRDGDTTDHIDTVCALRDAGRTAEYLAAAEALAQKRPEDVRARIEAAYAHDRYGTEGNAIVHYDAAHRLGVPPAERGDFLLGYGSTLRNVGRLDEAVSVLTEGCAQHPDRPALRVFLALALHARGRSGEALAAMIDALLDSAPSGSDVAGYARALKFYRDELRAGR